MSTAGGLLGLFVGLLVIVGAVNGAVCKLRVKPQRVDQSRSTFLSDHVQQEEVRD